MKWEGGATAAISCHATLWNSAILSVYLRTSSLLPVITYLCCKPICILIGTVKLIFAFFLQVLSCEALHTLWLCGILFSLTVYLLSGIYLGVPQVSCVQCRHCIYRIVKACGFPVAIAQCTNCTNQMSWIRFSVITGLLTSKHIKIFILQHEKRVLSI